jgi:hypothetical protein
MVTVAQTRRECRAAGEAMLLIEGVVGRRPDEEERQEYAAPALGPIRSVYRRPVVLSPRHHPTLPAAVGRTSSSRRRCG